MELKDQVCSLELAKELEKLGIKQESLFYWIKRNNEDGWEIDTNIIPDDLFGISKPITYSAYTVAELGEMLPTWITTEKREEKSFLCRSEGLFYNVFAKTEANARAKMLIYLIKEKLIKV